MSLASDPTAAIQAFLALGQSMMQGASSFAAQQQELGKQLAMPPAADAASLLALQQEWAAKQSALWQAMLVKAMNPTSATTDADAVKDRRFADPAWTENPMSDYLRRAYLLHAEYLKRISETLPVEDDAARERLRFMTRQFVDAMAPSNFAATNPEFIKTALETKGESVTRGIANLLGDLQKGSITLSDESAFEVGRNLAVTPGAVVFENELIQLIQYAPLTEQVGKRPLLLVPPCINKFYILDLQPENSLVRYAVAQGQTVFLVSWRNVQAEQGHLRWDDYLELGPLAALRVAREICAEDQINALGFCVGGTLLSAALAVAAARGEQPVASLTLLTTLLDYSDTGEVINFVDEQSLALREATIGKGGLLRGTELASVFSALRANDLIWQYVVGNYLKGGTPPMFDLLFWNADATNLPGPFAVWYLRHLYLENALREPGKLTMCDVSADLEKLNMPVFFYASREDHIVPWKTAYRGRKLVGGETSFVLGASGHIAGVVNPASKNKRNFWINEKTDAQADLSADDWLAGATEIGGSWWPTWIAWLARFSAGQVAARTTLGSSAYPVLEAAPGRYVKEKA